MSLLALGHGIALAATMAGTVQTQNGEPVAGATIEAYDLLLSAYTTETDRDGTWRLDDLPAGTWRVRAVAPWDRNLVTRWHPSAQSFCDGDAVVLAVDASSNNQDIELTSGATIDGRVTDGAGTPLSGEVVWAVDVDDETIRLPSRPAVTDAEGSFQIVGLDAPPDAAGQWSLYTEVDGFPDQFFGGAYDSDTATVLTVEVQSAATSDSWALLDGILVQGQASGPAGPLAGATVHVYAGGQVVTVATDDSGRYEAIGLPPGDVLPWVSAEGHGVTYFPDSDRPVVYAASPSEDGDVVSNADLYAPLESKVAVTFVGGASTVGDVGGLLYNDTRTVGRGDRADADGEMEIDRLHAGLYTLYAYGEAHGYADDWVRDAAGEPITIEIGAPQEVIEVEASLQLAASVTGTVTTDDGQPAAGALIALTRPSDGAFAATQTDRDGRYWIGGLGSGLWRSYATTDPLCPGDAGTVTVYGGPTVNPDWQTETRMDVGEAISMNFELPVDRDRDLMSDRWEQDHGLDVTRDDSAEDPDEDSYDNLTEYRLGTDPNDPQRSDACGGCGTKSAGLLLLFPLWIARRPRQT